MRPPAMSADEIAADPFAGVRVFCRLHGVCLYAGDTEPEGGAAAVAEAAGCPPWTALGRGEVAHDPDLFDACPVAGPQRAAQVAAAPVEAEVIAVAQQRTVQDLAVQAQAERDAAAGRAAEAGGVLRVDAQRGDTPADPDEGATRALGAARHDLDGPGRGAG